MLNIGDVSSRILQLLNSDNVRVKLSDFLGQTGRFIFLSGGRYRRLYKTGLRFSR